MKKIHKIALIITAVLTTRPALAQSNGGLDIFGAITNLGADLNAIKSVAELINFALSFVGVIFVIIIILAGLQWMTSGGNDEKIASAKKSLGAGIIGLIIILAAYAIAEFVVGNLITETGGNI